MDVITIINGDENDDQVIVNGRLIEFHLAPFLDQSQKDVWAIQWRGEKGEVEFHPGSDKINERIDSMAEFKPVMDEFYRLKAIEDAPPPPLTADQAHAKKLSKVNAAADAALVGIVSRYPVSEQLSWGKQEAEARSWLLDNTAETPMLDSISASRGLGKSVIAAKIIKKADEFAVMSGTIFGKRQKLEATLESLPTAEEKMKLLVVI